MAYSLHGVVDHALMRLGSLVESAARVDQHAASALASCARFGGAPIAAVVRYDWARILLDRGDPAALDKARGLAACASATAREIGTLELAQASAQLETCLASPPAAPSVGAPPPQPSDRLRVEPDGDVWALSAGSSSVRVRDSRGMHMLAQLVANPGRELHVLELSGTENAVDAGDAGEVLDRAAQSAYAARIRELETELDEASSWNDLGRRERLFTETKLLERELSRAFGKGGRERRVGHQPLGSNDSGRSNPSSSGKNRRATACCR